MREVLVDSPFSSRDWDEILNRAPGGSFFHTAAWGRVLHETYRYEPFYFTIRNNGKLESLLPIMEVRSSLTGIRGVSLPFSDYCDPIASGFEPFQETFAAATALGRKRLWRYLELRGGEAFLDQAEPSAWHYGHTVDLTQSDMDTFSDTTRRNIRKAEKQGLDVRLTSSADALQAFCRLNALTRKHHGLPPQPPHFFQSVHDNILATNRGFVVLVSMQGKTIAAAVYFTFADQILYKYGASDRTFQHLRANNLAMWKAIQWGREFGYRTLCMGRTEPDNEGLRKFKMGWGAKERKIRYYRYDLCTDTFVKAHGTVGPWRRKILRSLPVPVLKQVGRVLYRHMG